MPKIGPNKVSIDPKAYAARVTNAKKTVAAMDPTVKEKLEKYYPKVTKEKIVAKALDPKRGKKAAAKPLGTPPAKTTPMPKTTTKAPAKMKMTPQDAAMKKILEKKYGKIYG